MNRIWLCVCAAVVAFGVSADEWCGLTVAPEDRCSPYERHSDYTYNASIECDIVARAGLEFESSCMTRKDPRAGWLTESFRSPYAKGTKFRTIRESDIEHIVPAAEAHDSGLCAQPVATRTAFARDLDNLTLALPYMNRTVKSDKDPGQWLPQKNLKWYARTWHSVKTKYGLTVDPAERDALAGILDKCP